MLVGFLSLLASFCAALFIYATRRFHIQRTAKGHAGQAVQSSHRLPTSRIGGLALFFGGAAGFWALNGDARSILAVLFISALPVFLGGLGEDTGFNISPKMRLGLSFVSAIIAIIAFGIWLPPSGVYWLDLAVGWAPVLILFTILTSGGISHAINLIDGLNGLAIGISAIIGTGLLILSVQLQDTVMTQICVIAIAALMGLFAVNYPFGKIFLGDAGAYSVGHILTWIAILLLNRHDSLAPFAILLIFFWPLADMLFSIYRRMRAGKPVDQPDRLHFHQLVMRGLEIIWLKRANRQFTNPMATALILPMAALPVGLGVLLRHENALAAAAILVTAGLFVGTYRGGVLFMRWVHNRRD